MQEAPSDEEHVILCNVIFIFLYLYILYSLQMFYFKVIWGFFVSDKETAILITVFVFDAGTVNKVVSYFMHLICLIGSSDLAGSLWELQKGGDNHSLPGKNLFMQNLRES